MSNSIEYILSLNDQMSSKLQKIGINSAGAMTKFDKLQKQAKDSKKVFGDMGVTIGSLRQKLDLLRSEKEWIPASNVQSVKKYNHEIRNLEKEIQRLDTLDGSKFKRNMKSAFAEIPFSNLLTNPIVAAGGAIFKTTKMAMDFDTGMAQINTTAGLTKPKLANLKKELLGIDPKLVSNWGALPTAYESIISQTGDVALSTDILKSSLKGSKAGFTDVETVSKALAQSLSLIGKENASADQVLDTFMAAKKVGAGEFKDFAQYMPGLIASGDALGIKYKEVAGTFAYMTGKGQSAERSAVLMENAYSAMSKIDVRKNLSGAGINVFDEQGSIRSMTSIFGDLSKKMKGMSDEDKSSFLAKMGITDKEARSAFIVMSGDMGKLSESMNAVKNSAGETDKAFELSRNNGDRFRDMWSKIQLAGLKLGGFLNTILTPAIAVVGWVVGTTADTLVWLFDGISNGNPAVIALVTGVTALTVALKWSAIVSKAQSMWLSVLIAKERLMVIWTKAQAVATHVVTAATWLWETATWALNAAWMASPIGLIIAGAAAIGLAVYAVTKLINQQTAAEKLNGEVKMRAAEKSREERSNLDQLFDKLKKVKKGTEEHKQALQDLEAAYPGIIEKYDLANASLDQQNAAHQDLVKNIMATAEMESKQEILKEKYNRKHEIEDKFKNNSWTFSEKQEIGRRKLYGQKSEYDEVKESIKSLSSDLSNKELSKAKQAAIDGKVPGTDQGNGSKKLAESFVANTEEQIQEQLKSLREKKSKQAIGSEDYKSSEHEIARLENKLNPRSGGSGGRSTGSKTNEAIASGGSKQQTININFNDIIGSIAVSGRDFKESVKQMEEQAADGLLRVIGIATTTAG